MEETFGILSLLPPLIAIALAILTREILLSLFLGIFSGALILANYNPLTAMFEFFELVIGKLGDPDWNVRVIMVVVLLGGLVGLLTKSGGSLAFAKWIASRISSRKGAQGATWIMGILVFFDDYFNSLTIGTVMRPVTDQFKVSREKLAYILDSTAAPVCILAPVSSWVAYVTSLIAGGFAIVGITDQPFKAFLQTIPYNFYAWLAIAMVGLIIFSKLEFGPMAKAEKRALTTGQVYEVGKTGASDDDYKSMVISSKGKASDLVVPVIVLFAASIFFMIYTGGYFDGGLTIGEAFYETDAATSLIYGTFLAILVGIIQYRLRGSVTISDSMQAMVVGMKSMFFAVVLLTLAWSIGGISEALGTGAYLVSLIGDGVGGGIIPFAIYLLSMFIAFSTGSSWGTFAIMLPIAIPLAYATGADMSAAIAAVLAGGVFGDHCSPLADTTILSSTGAACNHIDHVKTQLPYAITVSISAGVGFLLAGFMHSPLVPFLVAAVLFVLSVILLHKFYGSDLSSEVAMAEEELQEQN